MDLLTSSSSNNLVPPFTRHLGILKMTFLQHEKVHPCNPPPILSLNLFHSWKQKVIIPQQRNNHLEGETLRNLKKFSLRKYRSQNIWCFEILTILKFIEQKKSYSEIGQGWVYLPRTFLQPTEHSCCCCCC